MSEDALKGLFLVIVIVVFSAMAGVFVGNVMTVNYYREEALNRGFAEYNSATGDWQWKGEPAPELKKEKSP